MSAWEAVAGPAREAVAVAVLEDVRKRAIGKRFLITGDHPHSGKTAECIGIEITLLGYRPKMKSDDGDEFFIMDAKHWRAIK